jgi:hypothetical protein
LPVFEKIIWKVSGPTGDLYQNEFSHVQDALKHIYQDGLPTFGVVRVQKYKRKGGENVPIPATEGGIVIIDFGQPARIEGLSAGEVDKTRRAFMQKYYDEMAPICEPEDFDIPIPAGFARPEFGF